MKINLFLTCSNCKKKHQNYRAEKEKNAQREKLSLRKFCKFCKKTKLHKEEIIK